MSALSLAQEKNMNRDRNELLRLMKRGGATELSFFESESSFSSRPNLVIN